VTSTLPGMFSASMTEMMSTLSELVFSRSAIFCFSRDSWSYGGDLLGSNSEAALPTPRKISNTQWVTLFFRNTKVYTKVLHQNLNPTAELWCKTSSPISRFGFTLNLSSRGLSSFAYLKALCRFGVTYRGLSLSLVLHGSLVLYLV